MTNFLEETLDAIKDSGHSVEDVHFIGDEYGEYSMTWEEFEKIANVEYDNGYGASEVATDLVIQFKDTSYMTRGEYDGSEWWQYQKPKSLYGTGKSITRLIGKGYGELWPRLSQLNGGEE